MLSTKKQLTMKTVCQADTFLWREAVGCFQKKKPCTLISVHFLFLYTFLFFNFRGNKINPCEINRPVLSSVVAVEQPTPKHARVPLSLPADDYFRAIAISITIAGQCSMMLIYLSLSLPKCHFHYHCQAMFDDAYLLVLVVAQLSTKD